MKTIVVKMPNQWDGQSCGFCCDCPLLRTIRKQLHDPRAECPLAAAKPAKKADINRIVVTHVHGAGARIENPRIDGKPVELFAVEKGE